MTTTTQPTTLDTSFEAARQVSEAFIAGATEVYQQLGQNWAQNVTPMEQRWQSLVNANASLFQQHSTIAQGLADQARLEADPGRAAEFDRWAQIYTQKANEFLDPLIDARSKLGNAINQFNDAFGKQRGQAWYIA